LRDPAQCARIAATLEAQNLWLPAVTGGRDGPRLKPALRRQDVVQAAATTGDLWDFAYRFAQDAADLWESISGRRPGQTRVLQYQRTLPGGHFRWHIDSIATRPIACVALLYLSDAGSHGLTGGATEFRIDGKEIAVAPVAGTAVLFHGLLEHRGAPVDAGSKIALACALGGS
jgi:hypothetical protein